MNTTLTSITIGSIVEKIIKETTNKPNYLEIFSDWPKIVGDYLSSISFPHKVVPIGSKKMLVLKTKKGYSLEIQHDSINILDTVNNFFGGSSFHKLKILQMDVNEFLNT